MPKKRNTENYPAIKEMYEKGLPIKEIAEAFGISKYSIYDAISIMGIANRQPWKKDEELVYADNKPPVLEKVKVYGKLKMKNGVKYRINSLCTDITPILSPR